MDTFVNLKEVNKSIIRSNIEVEFDMLESQDLLTREKMIEIAFDKARTQIKDIDDADSIAVEILYEDYNIEV